MSFLFQTRPHDTDSKNNHLKSSKLQKSASHNIQSNQTQQNILDLQQTLGNQEIQRMIKSGIIQPKLKISQPNDPYEREADKVADQIINMSDSYEGKFQTQNNSENKIYRKCSSCQMKQKLKEEKELKISRKSTTSSDNLEISNEISNQINNTSGGKSLDNTTKQFMESRFNHDLSDVRIHTDSRSQQLARSVNARAFTMGNNIFMGENESISDKRLMAHELTHVIQQSNEPTTIQRVPNSNAPSPEIIHAYGGVGGGIVVRPAIPHVGEPIFVEWQAGNIGNDATVDFLDNLRIWRVGDSVIDCPGGSEEGQEDLHESEHIREMSIPANGAGPVQSVEITLSQEGAYLFVVDLDAYRNETRDMPHNNVSSNCVKVED